MEKNNKVSSQVKRFLGANILINILWFCIAFVIVFIDKTAGIVVIALATCIVAMTIIRYHRVKKNMTPSLVEYGIEYGQVQRQLMKEMEIPYILIEMNGNILWTNNAFDEIERDSRGNSIFDIFQEITQDNIRFKKNKTRVEFLIKHKEKNYRIVAKLFTIDEKLEFSQVTKEEDTLVSVYFFDETELEELSREHKKDRIAVGQIYIDNFDETLESIEPARRTLLVALIDRRINKYFAEYDGVVRKVDDDKYFLVMKEGNINKLQSNKFSILDDVKNVNIGNGMPVTLSMGVGIGEKTLQGNNESAVRAIDMALGRGGDQAVLRDGNKMYYYGGKTKSVEKNTKVKARVKATAFRELVEGRDTVYIMGHHIGDNDSFGASVGFYEICRAIGKPAHIIVDQMSSTVEPLIDEFNKSEEYPEDMIISPNVALENFDKDDALIIVDCSRQAYVEVPELVRRAQCLMVFDHHRQSEDVIDNAQLSYFELSASSVCEMVVEIMQYISEKVMLTKLAAETIYGGIIIDTNNFINRTGVRTFEAAAYLKKNGADVSRVRRMFRENINDYKAKAKAIELAEVYREKYAITICNAKDVPSPTVVGAQVANELLNVNGIKAAFVCTPYKGQVYISARSVEKVNVQRLMEEYDGGGHINLAGAQVKDMTAGEVVRSLKTLIDNKMDEGEL